ncbi:hypothetical protein TNCV_2435771 [Trichonephila clavipes]|nr:hypothetical protein TNCV_2435771 [Trichonephila clavipes]
MHIDLYIVACNHDICKEDCHQSHNTNDSVCNRTGLERRDTTAKELVQDFAATTRKTVSRQTVYKRLAEKALDALRPVFTCRNCGGGDRGRVAIYRPFGEVSLSLNRTVTFSGRGSLAEIVEVEIEVVSPSIVPSGSFTELKSHCHLYGAQGQRQAYLLPMPR